MADIILQFQKQRKLESGVTAAVDVKATSEDIESSGKSPNITSYARIKLALPILKTPITYLSFFL